MKKLDKKNVVENGDPDLSPAWYVQYIAREMEKFIGAAAENGSVVAQRVLASRLLGLHYLPEDDAEAAQSMKVAADAGDHFAQYALGVFHYLGRGVAQSSTQAVKYWRMAAEQGSVCAMHLMGVAYGAGFGTGKDSRAAARWFRKAAEQGHAGSQSLLGDAYAAGRGVKKDLAEAKKWYALAAAQGDEEALDELKSLQGE